MVRAGERLSRARQDFGHAHEPRRKFITAALACVVALAAVSMLMVNWGETAPIDYVELPSRDFRVRTFASSDTRDPDILLINIDETALAYGDSRVQGAGNEGFAWPWPRHVHNKIIRYCREGGARVIAYDMTFRESGPNTNQVMEFREVNGQATRIWTLERASDDLFALEASAGDDVALALVLGGTERDKDVRDELLPAYAIDMAGDDVDSVLPGIASRFAAFRTSDAPMPQLLDGWPSIAAAGRDGDDKALRLEEGFRRKVNTDPALLASARYRSILPLTERDKIQGVAGIGHVMAFPDADGVIRSLDILGEFDGDMYASLPLEIWRLYVLSYAREAHATPSLRDGFAQRFAGLEVTDDGLAWQGRSYSLENKLRDVPVTFEGGKAHYLGRSMPLGPDGRVALRYHNWLPLEANANWRYLKEDQKQSLRERFPDGDMFAIYPHLSARDILYDWDAISDNRYKESETNRLRELVARLEQDVAAASDAELETLQFELNEARTRLRSIEEQETRQLSLGDPASIMKDKIVIVSGTASVLLDRHEIPLSDNAPGTWVIATGFDNLKNQDFMRHTPAGLHWALTLLLTAAALLGVFLAGRLRNGLLLTLLLGVLVLVCGWVLFTQQVWFPVAAPLAGLFLGFSNGALAKALTEGQQRRQREAFAKQYMGKELVDHVIRNPASLKLGGENREMTMFFSDVAGFTTVTETLGPNNPERLVELLNIYLERMTDLMLGTGGVIDKYIGDAIMCFWGAPMPQEDHAVRACRGALQCRAELQRMQPLFADAVRGIAPQLIKPDGTVLYARAGINSGVVTVGNMGSSKRFAYTVMGDAVNLAARLEPQCKEYGTDILIGQNTEAMVRGEFTLRPIDLMVVKGKTEPVEVFELLGDKDVPQFVLDLVRHFEEGVRLFRDRQFEAALACFRNAEHHEAIRKEGEVNPSRMYIRRCEDYIASPPPREWNGVVVKTSK